MVVALVPLSGGGGGATHQPNTNYDNRTFGHEGYKPCSRVACFWVGPVRFELGSTGSGNIGSRWFVQDHKLTMAS